MKILAIVVTYNRRELLSRCLDYILAQERKADEIIVINNDSTDGTEDMLMKRGIRFITQPNVGSAGGWHRGIECALDEGFDAVWMMDDDGFPDSHALEKLVPYLHSDIACVSSIVVCENDTQKFVFPFPFLSANHLPILISRRRKIATVPELKTIAQGETYDFAHLFNGALINTRAVRSIGNVNTEYFIFGDEVDYFFRLRTFGLVHSILSAIHYHPDVTNRPITSLKLYYYVKNNLILHSKYFDQVALRNILTIATVIWRTVRRNGLGAAIYYMLGKEGMVLYRAILRGVFGRIGKDYENR